MSRSVRRALRSGRSGAATVAFGTLSVGLGLAAVALDWLPREDWIYALLAFTVLVPVLLRATVGLAGYAALRSAPPDEYADATLAGVSASEMLKTLSFEMMSACAWYARISRELHAFLRDEVLPFVNGPRINTDPILGAVARDREALTARLERYRRELLDRQVDLRRLSALKVYAARNLGIPHRRLCDHVFEYSPQLQTYLSDKYADNFESLLRGFSSGAAATPQLVGRLRDLALKNKRIEAAAALCAERLDFLWGLDATLHEQIHRFASQHSSSGSLLAYARTLSYVARKGAEEELREFDGSPEDEAYDRIIRRYRFLQRKQKAYPGFDLHEACRRLCARARQRWDRLGQPDEELYREQETVLEEMARPGSRDFLSRNPFTKEQRRDEVMRRLGALEQLGLTVETYEAWACAGILDNFLQVLARSSPARRVFVTHGYSRMVRETLRRTPDAQSVFLMAAREAGPENGGPGGAADFDTRRMMYELREDPDSSVRYCWSGNEALFPRLYGADVEVVVVLGAESFDEGGNVLHPRGVFQRVQDLKQEMESCRVLVVAEEYKLQPGNLADANDLYEAHTDRIEVYPGGVVDAIVTEETVRPPLPPRRGRAGGGRGRRR